jgi:RNase P subunit RPR2
MSRSRATTASLTADVTMKMCPTCYPQRPMVIKSVVTSLLGKPREIVFQCPSCGAIDHFPALDRPEMTSENRSKS